MSTALASAPPPHDGINHLAGEDFDVITKVRSVQPFLMSVSSTSDFWLYLGSQGGVSCGRRNPDQALLPYYTEDKLSDLRASTGGLTLIRVSGTAGVWDASDPIENARRAGWVMKSINGDEVIFGEAHETGLELRTSWRVSPRYGLVRTCTLSNLGRSTTEIEILDGLQNLLPAGVTQRTQNELSILLDAYKRSEVTGDGFGIYSMSSSLTDLAEPAESLQAATAFRVGDGDPAYLASAEQVSNFRLGLPVTAEPDARGVRSAHLSLWESELAPGESISWTLVADTGLDSALVANLLAAFREGDIASTVAADLAEARATLARTIAAADGYQLTGDAASAAHHRSSVLFNLMRGGTFRDGNMVTKAGFLAHLRAHRPASIEALAPQLAELPQTLSITELLAWGRQTGDADAVRLTSTYLPLSFGRRHGDPSRPWNRFDIVVTDQHGEPTTGFQGNWRDVFQNWEALSWSYPEFTENMVAVFLNATTIDGYNPYRITHLGIDWEPEPDNPWANIGYWGDHQIVYLDRLLDLSQRRHPGALAALANEPVFAVADVPYRIAGFEALLANPAETITFDEAANSIARARYALEGADGLLRHAADGDLLRVGLGDKLLTLLLAKLVNFVPDGGIWMNTQRPEWNDANNALAGPGLSVVTMAQLIPFVKNVGELLADADITVRGELAELLRSVTGALTSVDAQGDVDDRLRAEMVHALGRAGERYRAASYGDGAGLDIVSQGEVKDLLATALAWLSRSVGASARGDGLFHSYNTIELSGDRVGIGRLPLMLEGQVAVLGSGILTAEQALRQLTALRHSPLYREDQNTYVLYPDKELPGFLEKNVVSEAWRPDLAPLLADASRRVVHADNAGDLHFAAGLKNSAALAARLVDLAAEGFTFDAERVLAAYEDTFGHATFTGRSGTFFAYEGLGSIYWHMVSKLVLAAREAATRARDAADPAAEALTKAYRDVWGGLGFAKDAYTFGAFPTDAYSHTPRHAGAKQPGMTGQVKEDVIARFAELGVTVEAGQVSFNPNMVAETDWLTSEAALSLPGGAQIELDPQELCFTLCAVPVVYRRGGTGIRIDTTSGTEVSSLGALSVELTARLFERDGFVHRITVG